MSTPPTRWMSPPPIYDFPSPHRSETTLTTYLQLPHILSLAWLAYPILSLLFVAFRLTLSSGSAQDAVDHAKTSLLASCKAAEGAATSAASLPRYMAIGTNESIQSAVNDTMTAARATLVLALTVMEAIINFVVDTYRSTFLCFLELAVRGTLSILIGAVQEFNTFLTSTFSSLRTSIQNDVNSANSVIQSAVAGFNKINPFGNISIPPFSVPSLDSLQNVTLPTDVEDALVKLNSSLPSISDLKNSVESIIDTPFELVKKDINDTFSGLSFDVNAIAVPPQNRVSFCDEMDTSVIDDLGRDLMKIFKIGLLLMFFVALLMIGANCALEWYKWRQLKRHLQRTRESWITDPSVYHAPTDGLGKSAAPTVQLSDHNLMTLQANSAHPLLTTLANRLSVVLRLRPSHYIHLRWFLHYVFHPPALACFLIGFFGLLSVEIQMIAVRPLADKFSKQAVVASTDFADTIATQMNNSMFNQSATYANDINTRIITLESQINNGLFSWVNQTTTTLNDTVNTFYTDVQNVVHTVFNGTILESPAEEFIRCFLGSKVDAVEKALTFLHDNLHVQFPRVNESVLVLSPERMNEVTQPIATAAIGGGEGNNEGIVGKLVNTYLESLKAERVIFGAFMGLWGFVCFLGLCIVFWHSYGRDWLEAHRKRKWQRKQRTGIHSFVVPFRDHGADTHAKPADGGEKAQDLPSFTPMPSPKPGLLGNMKPPSSVTSSSHPLSIRKPEFEKSWDSFLDKAEPGAPKAKKSIISAPKRLMTIGRLGKERSAGDSEESTAVENGGQGETVPWTKRLNGAYWFKKGSHDTEAASTSEGGVSQARIRPHLTISTSHADRESDRRVVDRESARPPASAWSVSPGAPRKLPWMQQIVPTLPSVGSLRPKSRRLASVPSDVNSDGAFSVLEPQPVAAAPFAMPLHHGFDQPAPPTLPIIRSPSPPLSAKSPEYGLKYPVLSTNQPTLPVIRSPSPPLSAKSPVYGLKYPVLSTNHLAPPPARRQPTIPQPARSSDPDTCTPVTRLLTTHHARHSSQAVDPFATPFDDEHYAPPPMQVDPSSARRSVPTNPFIAMAI